jgi:hypothetical protein
LRQQQFALTPTSEAVLRFWADWRQPESSPGIPTVTRCPSPGICWRQVCSLGTPLMPVPTGRPDDAKWPPVGFLDAAYGRRSTRTFAPEPLPLADLSVVLEVAGGFVDIQDDSETGPSIFKTSPSAGARRPP